jgi:hypothetical protein
VTNPAEKEKLYWLDKKTVAKAQLQTSIFLWFNEGDPASILSLAVNANDCYTALGGHVGKASVFQQWLSTKSKEFQRRSRLAQNFIKHGRLRLTGSVPYSPRLAEVLILDSIDSHQHLEGQITMLMQLFDYRFALEHSERLGAESRARLSLNLPITDYLRKQERPVFFKRVREELRKAGRWTI